MNDLIVKTFEEQQVRIQDQNGDPWFSTKDICRVLGIKNARDAVARLDSDERGVVIADTLGGPQKIRIVNEPGLYRLVFASRKPEAKR